MATGPERGADIPELLRFLRSCRQAASPFFPATEIRLSPFPKAPTLTTNNSAGAFEAVAVRCCCVRGGRNGSGRPDITNRLAAVQHHARPSQRHDGEEPCGRA